MGCGLELCESRVGHTGMFQSGLTALSPSLLLTPLGLGVHREFGGTPGTAGPMGYLTLLMLSTQSWGKEERKGMVRIKASALPGQHHTGWSPKDA